MAYPLRRILSWLLSFLAATAAYLPLTAQERPYVIVLSMDGFRWDYPGLAPTPNLDRIARDGVKAEALIPAFPTVTFPNHYTLATGLYPDHHGLIHNSFYDPGLGKSYAIGKREAVRDPEFYGGEPLWVTAEKQGVRTASFFWVGSEAPIQGIMPSYNKTYDPLVPFAARIDTVIAWLNLPESRRPHLILCYFHEPDKTGHHEGPDGRGISPLVQRLDSLVGVLVSKAAQTSVAAELNLVILSDHGMGPVGPGQTICLEDYLKEKWFTRVEGGNPVFNFSARDKFRRKAWAAIQEIPHCTAWEHGKVPARFVYGENPRTLDFILLADSAWQIVRHRHSPGSRGAHGYDNLNRDMHAIFYADGPAFRDGQIAPPFRNVNIYPLICHILGIITAPNDGSLEEIREILRD